MRVVILVLLAALVWTGSRLAEVERQRYALLTGLCEIDDADPRPFFQCMETAEPRTSRLWDLVYGLGLL